MGNLKRIISYFTILRCFSIFIIICFFSALQGIIVIPAWAKYNFESLQMILYVPAAHSVYSPDYLPNRVDKNEEELIIIDEIDGISFSSVVASFEVSSLPPTDNDLTETDGVKFTPKIMAKAAELEYNPEKIILWARDNLDFQPYWGMAKGSAETLNTMAGNSHDISSFAIAMLRYCGIPARYIKGTAKLSIRELMNWTGGKTPEAAVYVLHNNRIPIIAYQIFNNETQQYEITRVEFDHIWISYFYNDMWTRADASYKAYAYNPPADIEIDSENIKSLAENLNISGNTVLPDFDLINTNVLAQTEKIETAAGELSLEEFFGTRKIVKTIPAFADAAIFWYGLDYEGEAPEPEIEFLSRATENWEPKTESAVLLADEKFIMKVIMPGGNEAEFILSKMAGKRLSLVYNPATAADQAICPDGDYYSLSESELASFKVIPVFKIGDEIIVTGTTSVLLGDNTQKAKIGFLRPCVGQWEFIETNLLAGNRYNIPVATQKKSLEELKARVEELKTEIAGIPDDESMSLEMIDKGLHVGGVLYFNLFGEYSEHAAKALNVFSVGHIAAGFVSNSIRPMISSTTGKVVKIEKVGWHIDLPRIVVSVTSLVGDKESEKKYMFLCGFISSSLEHEIFYILFGTPAISTCKVMQKAAEQGIPIHILDNKATVDTDLLKITADASVKSSIRASVLAGRTVLVPEKPVSVEGWEGQVWIAMDEETGAAGYMIQGNLAGGETTAPIQNKVYTAVKIYKAATTVGKVLVIQSTFALGSAVHIAGAGYVAASITSVPVAIAAAPFLAAGCVIGTLIAAAGIMLSTEAITNYFDDNGALYIKRREYYV